MWTSREHSGISEIHLLAIAEQAGLTDASLKPSESHAKILLRCCFFFSSSKIKPSVLKTRHLAHFSLFSRWYQREYTREGNPPCCLQPHAIYRPQPDGAMPSNWVQTHPMLKLWMSDSTDVRKRNPKELIPGDIWAPHSNRHRQQAAWPGIRHSVICRPVALLPRRYGEHTRETGVETGWVF